MKQRIFSVLMAVLIIGSSGGLAAAAPGLNFGSDMTPDPEIQEDTLTIAKHDRTAMSGPLQYYDDSGNVATLPASVNTSQDTPYGVRFDQISADAYNQFPRTDAESDNTASWTKAGEVTTSSGASSSISVTDADTDGVEKVQFDASVASTETATGSISSNVSITSDVDKRVMFAVVNVNGLASSASEVQLRAVDSDGDYRYATIQTSASANSEEVIANSTGNGYVFQERLSNLPIAGTGDGAMQEIQSVDVVVKENDADVTLAGLDLDTKSERDLAEIERDTDNDGELEKTTVQNIYNAGPTKITGLDTLGPAFDSAVINDLEVYDVTYSFSDLTDEGEYSTEFSDATDYSYDNQLELYADIEVPSAIDLTHGTLEVEFDQGLVGERYAVAEIAENVDSDEEFGNFSDTGDYSSWTGSLAEKGDTVTVDATTSADTNYRVHMVVLLQPDEVDTLQSVGGAFGPTGSGSGGFFSTLTGQITAVVGGVLGFLGLRRRFGG